MVQFNTSTSQAFSLQDDDKDDCSVSTFTASDRWFYEQKYFEKADDNDDNDDDESDLQSSLEAACKETICSKLDKSILKNRKGTYDNSSVALTVDFHLARRRDANRSNRVELAKEVKNILSHTMGTSFNGTPISADFILLTRVILAVHSYHSFGFGKHHINKQKL